MVTPNADAGIGIHRDIPATRTDGPALLIARIAVAIIIAASVAIVTLSVLLRFSQLHTICAADPCTAGHFLGQSGQLGPAGVRTLASHGLSLGGYAAILTALDLARPVVALTLALLLVGRKAVERMALVVSLGLVSFGLSNALDVVAARWTGWQRVAAVNHSFAATVSVALFLYLLPDGRFVPRWTRWLAAVAVAWYLPGLIFPGSILDTTTWSPLSPVLSQLAFWGIGLGAQVHRYRAVSDAAQRQQTKWIVYGFGSMCLVVLAVIALSIAFPALEQPGSLGSLVGRTLITGALLLAPLSVGVAILRYRLFDIDLLINRTLVYAALTACVLGIYIGSVGVLGALLRVRGSLAISLVGTALVAVLFQPLRGRLQRAVNRAMYGERDDPYAVLSQLGQRLETTLAPDAILTTVVETVRDALKLPYAAIALRREDALVVAATAGRPSETVLRLPLVYQHEEVGELSVAPRARGEPFGPTDRRLLNDLARQAGIAAHAVRLTADLQASRERLVTAREEERRRLRRDLHDGLGPRLGAQMLRIGAARQLLERDPHGTDALLAALESDVDAALADIRRLVYDLRPPTLDELGLIEAIRESAMEYDNQQTTGGAPDGNTLRVSVEAPERLPPLSAAIEVATYRIVQEALTNVARHADAHDCAIRLTLDEATRTLRIIVTDNGVGIPAMHRAGIGLTSMRERATELGGTFAVERLSAGGTRVSAYLPLPHPG